MQPDKEPFWDDLGVAWRASIPDARLVSSRLESRLERQQVILTAGTALALLACVVACALAVWALWIGWSIHAWNFLTRGATLLAVAGLAAAAAWALRTRGIVDTRSLLEMLQTSIIRTERLVRAADLGCVSVAIIAIGGLVGYAIRTRAGRPPSMSPMEDLFALALAAFGLLIYRWSQARALRRYRHLVRVFSSESDVEQGVEAGEVGP